MKDFVFRQRNLAEYYFYKLQSYKLLYPSCIKRLGVTFTKVTLGLHTSYIYQEDQND